MARDHHDFKMDKDTPESIRELVEQSAKGVMTSQNGLPSDERLNHYFDPEGVSGDENDPFEAAREIPIHGVGADRALPNQFRKESKTKRY